MTCQGEYAPLDIIRDTVTAEDRFDLIGTRIEHDWGSAYARHRRLQRSDTATVFLHGASGCWTGFTPLLETAELAGIDILDPVLIDLPGWGDGKLSPSTNAAGSPASGIANAVSIDKIADLVLSTLDALGFARARVVGHSMGGLIALHLAATAPERITAVDLISPTSFAIIDSVDHPIRRFLVVPAFTMLWKVMAVLRALGGAGRMLVNTATRVGLMRVIFAPLFRHGERMRESVILATVDGIDPRAFLMAADVVRSYDAVTLWSRIRCPVSVVAGDHDVFVGENDLAQLQRTLPRARITTIAECGHFALVEWPGRTLASLGFGLPRDG